MCIRSMNDKCASFETCNENECNANKKQQITVQSFSSNKNIWRKKENAASVCNKIVSFALLPTVHINLIDSMGQKSNVRVKFESRSDASLVSESGMNY